MASRSAACSRTSASTSGSSRATWRGPCRPSRGAGSRGVPSTASRQAQRSAARSRGSRGFLQARLLPSPVVRFQCPRRRNLLVQTPGCLRSAGVTFWLSRAEHYQSGRTEPAMNPSVSLKQLREENQHLKEELRRQWELNHWDRCCERWPHSGECHWPPPPGLEASEGGSQ